MVLRRGKFSKPKRGGSHRFSSSRDPSAYVTGPVDEEEDGDSGEGVEDNTKKLESVKVTDLSSPEPSSSSEEEEDPKTGKPAKVSVQTKKEPHELSRKEREAIEKERAKQHFLKMKAKEDAVRLAVVKQQREEAAAVHAAALKKKEEDRLARRG